MRKESTSVGHKKRNLRSVYSTLSVLIEDKMLKNIISSGMILIKNWKVSRLNGKFTSSLLLASNHPNVKSNVKKAVFLMPKESTGKTTG
uniref:Transposase n=1 Tax=Strongyloides venezuelensis TaxID=75913 RepID=A0A0K0G402_STRVS